MKTGALVVPMSLISLGLLGCSTLSSSPPGGLPRVAAEALHYGEPEAALTAYDGYRKQMQASGYHLTADKNDDLIADLRKIVERKREADDLLSARRYEAAFEHYRELHSVWPRGVIAERVLELAYLLARNAQLDNQYELALTYYETLLEGFSQPYHVAALPKFLAAQVALCYFSAARNLLEKNRAASAKDERALQLEASSIEENEERAKWFIQEGLRLVPDEKLGLAVQRKENRDNVLALLDAAIARGLPQSRMEVVSTEIPTTLPVDPAVMESDATPDTGLTRRPTDLERLRKLAATTVSPAVQQALTARISGGGMPRSAESQYQVAPPSAQVGAATSALDRELAALRTSGYAKMAEDDYAGALQAFEAFLVQRPENVTIKAIVDSLKERLTFDALLREAALAEYPEARIRALEQFIARFPNRAEAPRVLWDLSGTYIQIRDFENARRALERLIIDYPDSPLVTNALKRQSQLK